MLLERGSRPTTAVQAEPILFSNRGFSDVSSCVDVLAVSYSSHIAPVPRYSSLRMVSFSFALLFSFSYIHQYQPRAMLSRYTILPLNSPIPVLSTRTNLAKTSSKARESSPTPPTHFHINHSGESSWCSHYPTTSHLPCALAQRMIDTRSFRSPSVKPAG